MGKVVGGIFGGGKKQAAPAPMIIPAPVASIQTQDPTQAAYQELDAQKKRKGRQSLRVDLSTPPTGSGLYIPRV